MTEFSVNQPVIWQVRVGEKCVEKHGFVSRVEGSDRDAIQIRVKDKPCIHGPNCPFMPNCEFSWSVLSTFLKF